MNSTANINGAAKRRKGAWRFEWAERCGWLAKGMVPGPRPKDTFIYRDTSGSPIVRKTKWELLDIESGEVRDKTYVVKHRTRYGWERGIGPDAAWLMYYLPELLVARTGSEAIYWTEGEKDARAAVRSHYGAATTHYQGKAPVRERQAEWFRGFKGSVHLVMDYDPVGVQVAWQHARLLRDIDVRYQFVAPRVRRLKADLSDHIAAGYGPDDLVIVTEGRMQELIGRYGELGKAGSSRVGSYTTTPEEMELIAGFSPDNCKTRDQVRQLELESAGLSPIASRVLGAALARRAR